MLYATSVTIWKIRTYTHTHTQIRNTFFICHSLIFNNTSLIIVKIYPFHVFKHIKFFAFFIPFSFVKHVLVLIWMNWIQLRSVNVFYFLAWKFVKFIEMFSTVYALCRYHSGWKWKMIKSSLTKSILCEDFQ